jgi:glycolate oxidase FAD binding subunit
VGIESLDGVPFAGTLRPADASEVATLLADARGRGAALVPTGGASKLHWGNRSDAEQLERLDLSGLGGHLEVNAAEGIATVGAGVRAAELERAVREVGKRTRLPGLYAAATVGGTIAADPVGPDSQPDNRLRNELLGIEVALTNGELTRSGGRVVKNVTGFDLVRMYCGSLGTLGVITLATLRLWPLPESRTVRVREFGSVDAAIEAAHAILVRGVQPAGLAVLPDDAGAKLVWCIEGAKVDVEERGTRVEGERVDESQWSEAARSIAGAEVPAGGNCVVRMSGRPSDAAPIARSLAEAGGCLRAALPALAMLWAVVEEAALPGLAERAEQSRWTLFVERADPACKSGRDVFAPLPDGLPLMRALKARFDPERVLNPGRFVGGI